MKKTASVMERALPNNPEAERALLGVIILDGSLYQEAMIDREKFFDHRHQLVWDAFGEIVKRGSAIDLVTLVDFLVQSGQLHEAGGAPYVSELFRGQMKTQNVEQYARLVRDAATRRRAISLAESVKERAFVGDSDAGEIVEESARAFVELSASSMTTDWVTEFDASMEALRRLEDDYGPRIFTGIQAVDSQTGGFIAGELIEVVSGTGVGKTLFARQIQHYNCRNGWHGLYASGEMFAWHLASRRIFSNADVAMSKYRDPKRITDEDRARLTDQVANACRECVVLDGDLTLARIRAAARKMAKRTRLGLVVIDYDSLVAAPGKDQNERQIALMRGAKAIGMENACAVINISQLRKSPAAAKSGKDAPILDDIYGSKTTTAHPSWVFYIEREYMKTFTPGTEANARIVIMKARDGMPGEVEEVKFDISRLRFKDAASY